MTDSALNNRPDRMTITNVETGDVLEMQFNPQEIDERVAATFNDLAIMGLSHKPDQFQNTENLALDFDLPFNALAFGGDVQALDSARKFLHHLCYPVDGQDVRTGGTPRVMVIWPGLYGILGRVRTVAIKLTRFNNAMQLVAFNARVSMTETRTSRITSGEVLDFGTVRS